MNRREYDADDWRSDRLREIAAEVVGGLNLVDEGDGITTTAYDLSDLSRGDAFRFAIRGCWDGVLSGFRWDSIGPDYSGEPGRMGLVREEHDGETHWSDSRFREMVTECIEYATRILDSAGRDAIDWADQFRWLRVWSYASPVDDGGWVDLDLAREIAQEDPSLIRLIRPEGVGGAE